MLYLRAECPGFESHPGQLIFRVVLGGIAVHLPYVYNPLIHVCVCACLTGFSSPSIFSSLVKIFRQSCRSTPEELDPEPEL